MVGWHSKQRPRSCKDAVSSFHRGGTSDSVLPLTLPRSNDVWLHSELRPVTRREEQDPPSTSGRYQEVRWPLKLGISIVKGGKVDLQLRVVEFAYGTEMSSNLTPLDHGARGVVHKAASLLFLRTVFPDKFPALEKGLALSGLAAAAKTIAKPAAARLVSRGQLQTRLLRLKPSWQISGLRLRSKGGRGRARAVSQQGREMMQAAALLAVAAALWKFAHPGSYRLAQALTVAFQLSSGYADTSRQIASGRIQPGPGLEAAWRARHKWAARKAAPVLTDVYESPPLLPALSAAQRLSITLIMLANNLPGQPLSPISAPICGSGALTAVWCLYGSYPAGRRLPEEGAQAKSQAVGQPVVQAGVVSEPEAGRPALNASGSGAPGDNLDQAGPSSRAASVPLPAHFVPSPEEGLPTSSLPTITCFEELAAYQSAPHPIAVTADATQDAQQGGQAGSEKEIVPFSTEELMRLEPSLASRRPWNAADEVAFGAGLPLFGRADHTEAAPLTLLERQQMGLRAVYLVLLFLPFMTIAPLLLVLSRVTRLTSRPSQQESTQEGWARATAWRMLVFCVRNSGAAAIKWAQWSATREDMFPADLCAALSQLHDAAPTHSWRDTERQIRAAFGRSSRQLFESIDHRPLASGSIAQVHRAVMVIDGRRRNVAVKVRHPGVDVRIRQDFQLLHPIAAAASRVPALKGLSLKESLAQFSSTMTAQTDLRVEAAHLLRFCRNFVRMRESITPPFPIPGFISESVLIETFEPGQSVARFIRQPAPFNTQIVALGVDTYLKMLLTDNFVHTDLHPGNILVRRRDGGELSPATAAAAVTGGLQLVLLDFGLAEELTPAVRRHFISFLHMIAKGDSVRAAHHILRWSRNQTCPDPHGFTMAMQDLFRQHCNIQSEGGIELDLVMKEVLRAARKFEVSIDSGYAALVVGVAVIVGFATSLDPQVNLMDAAAPAFLQNNLLGRVTGRLYS